MAIDHDGVIPSATKVATKDHEIKVLGISAGGVIKGNEVHVHGMVGADIKSLSVR